MKKKVLLDACVLYPTVMREVLLHVAAKGLFIPLWSDRILEEWARAARKIGPTGEAQARGEVALLKANWPKASIKPQPGLEARLYLPDENDIHVLAVAIAGNADELVTMNTSDFPKNTLREEGIERRDPDGFLWELASHYPDEVGGAVEQVRLTAERLSGAPWEMRALMKKARLPRLGKALGH
jgi:predicted nucleic acid-binding protein